MEFIRSVAIYSSIQDLQVFMESHTMVMDGANRKNKTNCYMVHKSIFGVYMAIRMDQSKTFTLDSKYCGNFNRVFSLQARNVLLKINN